MLRTPSQRALSAAVLACVGAQAAHWFITPMRHPDASSLRAGLVAIQARAGFGGAFWLLRSRRSDAADTPAS